MAEIKINHSDVPIRLFRSDLLEFFTHIHPAVVVTIWLPVAVFFFVQAWAQPAANTSAAYIPIGFGLGLFVWTFAEYTLHRFVFHFHPRSPQMQRLVYLFHGIHHEQPQCKTRLVMPPVVSLPLAVVFYALYQLGLGTLLNAPQWINPMFSGFVVGYLIYDITHYATHHFPMRWGFLKFLKRYHMQHHYKTPEQRFGVSSPMWDKVFGTLPAE